ncbi:3D domain-containing protein [Gillisia sp. Q332]|uniref:3D domain-containing protein n=1 Tax=Gillisia xinjiangensis TaxID=3384765 RepID=UPI00391A4876
MIKLNSKKFSLIGIFLYAIFGFSGCESNTKTKKIPKAAWQTLRVSASAYNSTSAQTEGNPKITAWGDTLKPGMKVIAVSRDLIRKGLDNNTPVRIEGLEGIFFVKDKMHHRWKNKIDIYMGEDIQKARNWGRKRVFIHYLILQDSVL